MMMITTSRITTATCYDKHNRILSHRTNSYTKTHPFQKYLAVLVGHNKKEYLHAEIAAILAAKTKPIHTIIIKRFNHLGQPMLAKPCPICSHAIKIFKIKNVHYTT